ncbi:Arabinogalactan peptide [Canna indica]|uniref:Arabinogalactan peptide n=1 Tax=Canna indica TaxID=4628 RepID=A0AAQ3K7F8_9LILI|nr:Arabinogalactan peptide [Canna indica]
MASSSSSVVAFALVALVALFISTVVPVAQAQATAPAPAPTNDGTSIDQGIAYMLMLVALVLTYLIHAADASSGYKLF